MGDEGGTRGWPIWGGGPKVENGPLSHLWSSFWKHMVINTMKEQNNSRKEEKKTTAATITATTITVHPPSDTPHFFPFRLYFKEGGVGWRAQWKMLQMDPNLVNLILTLHKPISWEGTGFRCPEVGKAHPDAHTFTHKTLTRTRISWRDGIAHDWITSDLHWLFDWLPSPKPHLSRICVQKRKAKMK